MFSFDLPKLLENQNTLNLEYSILIFYVKDTEDIPNFQTKLKIELFSLKMLLSY